MITVGTEIPFEFAKQRKSEVFSPEKLSLLQKAVDAGAQFLSSHWPAWHKAVLQAGKRLNVGDGTRCPLAIATANDAVGAIVDFDLTWEDQEALGFVTSLPHVEEKEAVLNQLWQDAALRRLASY